MTEPYYDDGSCVIYHGDCREILPTLAPVDLVITSPPYNLGDMNGGLANLDGGYDIHRDTLAADEKWHHSARSQGCGGARHRDRTVGTVLRDRGETARAGSSRLWGFGMSDEKVLVEHVDGSTSWAVPVEKHPATYSKEIVAIMAEELLCRPWPGKLVLDPFAGQGRKLAEIEDRVRAARRAMKATGVEIEAEWAACAERGAVLVGDSTKLPAKWSSRFGAVVTSPCYGNRFADSHTPKDACTCRKDPKTKEVVRAADPKCSKCKGSGLSPRRSYTHDLGHALAPGSAGAMHYGDAYRELHRAVYGEVCRVLKPGGIFLLNIKDHVRDKRRVRVCEWTRRTIVKIGLVQEAAIVVRPPGLKYGANRDARVGNEIVYVFRKPEV